MASVEIAQVSFTKGEISPIAADRTDAAFYGSALNTCLNFFVHAEGGASNRPGLQFIGNSLSNTPNGSYLLPFIFNNQVTYITEFAAGAIQLYANGAFVQNQSSAATITNITVSGGLPPHPSAVTVTANNTFTAGQNVTIAGVIFTGSNPNGIWAITSATPTSFSFSAPSGFNLTYVSGGTATVGFNLSNPYALTDLASLRWAQSADVLNVVVGTQPIQQLTRVTSNTFTLTPPQLLFGPFQDVNTDGTTTVFASAINGTVTLTASAGIFKPQHVGALFYLQEQFLGSVIAWEAQKTIAPGSNSPVGLLCRSSGNIYRCVAANTSSTATATGSFQPVHEQGTQTDGDGGNVPNFAGVSGVSWQFLSTNAGVALITAFTDSKHVTAVVQSHKGVYANFPPTVVGGPQNVVGAFIFSGNGSQTSFGPLTLITVTDPNQFYVTVGGIFQDPSTYTIVGTQIVFYTAPVAGANNISVAQVQGTLTTNNCTTGASVPLPGLCLSTYWAFGSVSAVQGYPSDVCFFNDRLVLSGTTLQPQSFWASKVSDYLNFGFSDPQVDSDSITETINARQQNPINNLLPMNNLLLGTASASWRATDTTSLGAITPTNIALVPQEFYGMQPVPAVQTGITIIYVQWGGRKIRDILYQFYSDKFLGQELTLFARHIVPFGTTITRIAYAPEPYGIIYCVRSDGVLCVCSYVPTPVSFTPEQQLIAWSRWTTAGNFEDVVVVPENGSYSVYVIVGRTVSGVYQRYIERFAPREFATINDAFFVDSGLTYDGRNTSTTTMAVTGGTTWQANDTGTLSASSTAGWAGFATTNPTNNDAIWLNDASGNRLCRLQITAFISVTQVKVLFLDPVPISVQGVPVVNWTFAKTAFFGLTNLVGQTVSVFADGSVQAQQVVASTGQITLQYPSGVVHAGLPYTSQLESLNFNLQGSETIRNRSKTVPRLSVVVDQSYPFMAGPDFVNMVPVVQREFEPYTAPISPHTGVVNIPLKTTPTDDASVCIQMTDPAPVRILGWVAQVDVGESG